MDYHMDLNKILSEYDEMFGRYSLQEIEGFLLKNLSEARFKFENEVLVALLNETIGFYRDTTQKEKALKLCGELNELLISMNLQGSIAYATSLLNIANAFRAFGVYKESLLLFEKVDITLQDYLLHKLL